MELNSVNSMIEFREEKGKLYSQESKSDLRKENEDKDDKEEMNGLFCRNEFSRDRDRIKFSRAFRRLEHKAQIYTFSKGDHFRTRLTHSLEVTQIARSIARNLGLNEDLVEAISLGHDIGHTPFGHQGERTLDKVMSGEDDLSGKLNHKINYGGFKHNFNSVKILEHGEVKFLSDNGMNLTWQVLEGILKHTGLRNKDIRRFTKNEKVIEYYHINTDSNGQKSSSVTLEGQVVAIADEIAQREHDIDDGLRDKDLTLNFNNICKDLLDGFETIIKESRESYYIDNLKSLLNSIQSLSDLNEDKCETNIEKKNLYLYRKNALVRDIIDFFIKDVTLNSFNLMMQDIDSISTERIFKKQLINLSTIGDKVNKIIESYVNVRILNSYNVNRFDGKAIYVVRQLFKAYYTNPRQMLFNTY